MKQIPSVHMIRAAFLLVSAALPCQAVVTFGISSGTGIDVQVSATDLADLEAGPLGASSGTAPGMYATNNSVLTVNVSAVLGSVAATDDGDGAINSSASSDVDGLGGFRTAFGTSTVNGLNVLLVESLIPGDLLSITATTLGSTSTSSGDFGVLGSVGTSVFQDLNITVGGNAVYVNLNSSPAPNTILLNAGGVVGLTIVLNEQIATGNGTSSTGLTTNALHVYFNAVDFGPASGITGDIVVGQSISGLVAIPEPGIAMIAVLSGMLLMGRRRRAA